MFASVKSMASSAIFGSQKSGGLSNSKKAEIFKQQMDGFAKNAAGTRLFKQSNLSEPKEGSKLHTELKGWCKRQDYLVYFWQQ